MAFNWKLFVNPAGIPSGFELVCDYAVMHPTRQEAGALIRNKKHRCLCDVDRRSDCERSAKLGEEQPGTLWNAEMMRYV